MLKHVRVKSKWWSQTAALVTHEAIGAPALAAGSVPRSMLASLLGSGGSHRFLVLPAGR